MSTSNFAIGRGWAVVSADGKRVGDVTEVHPHYLLVSRGVIMVRDIFLPLGTVARAEDKKVTLSVTYEVLRGMNLSQVPQPVVEEPSATLQDPAPAGYEPPAYDYQAPVYEPETSGDSYVDPWASDGVPAYEEMPSYTKPQPNGLVEVEHALNLAFADLGYGATVLLLQGWPFDSTIWEPLPSVLAQDHRIVTFDPRGLGGSDRPWDFYSVEILSNDLHRLIVEQSLREVTIVGWSTGALVALLYAHEHRDRVARLLLLNPLIPAWLADPAAEERFGARPELDAATQQVWATELLDDRPTLHERLVDRLTDRPLSSPQRHWIWQRLMHGAPHAQLKTWQALCDYDPAGILEDIKAPVTILSGENDRLSPPAAGAALAALLPRAQSLVLSDCGHAPFLDQRAAVVKAIEDLIGVVDSTPPIEEYQAPETGEGDATVGDA